jgi:hypothetical protein
VPQELLRRHLPSLSCGSLTGISLFTYRTTMRGGKGTKTQTFAKKQARITFTRQLHQRNQKSPAHKNHSQKTKNTNTNQSSLRESHQQQQQFSPMLLPHHTTPYRTCENLSEGLFDTGGVQGGSLYECQIVGFREGHSCLRAYGAFVAQITLQYNTVQYGTIRCGTVQYDMTRHDTIRERLICLR